MASVTQAQAQTKGAGGAGRVLLLGTLIVGTLDMLDALTFFGFVRGAKLVRIPQSIAAGLLGREAFNGGAATAVLGVLLHYFIAFGIVFAYWFASRRLHVLIEHPIMMGLLFGVACFFVMSYIVIPLSASGRGPFVMSVFLNGIIGHALLVGLPAALVVSRGGRS